MLLTLDIGNTNIKTALFTGDEIINFNIHRNSIEALEYINRTKFKNTAICSVNPSIEEVLENVITDIGISVFTVNVKSKFNFQIEYKTPDTLGMDRLCSVVGALNLADKKNMILDNQYLITIDFGTATTINILSPDRKFIGGLIAPGLKTMLNSLKEKTAQLPLIESGFYGGVIGDSTKSSILNGVFTATIGMISETINQLTSESNKVPLIFTTGGNAEPILPHIKHKIIYDKALVLRGLKVAYDLND